MKILSRALNDQLYRALVATFRDVAIHNEGEPCSIKEVYNAQRGWSVECFGGEYYSVTCPFCDDNPNKKRLWINHRWGTVYKGRHGTYRLNHLAHCYHNNCDLSHLPTLLRKRGYGFGRVVLPASVVVANRIDPLPEVEIPQAAVSVDQLPASHAAVHYLTHVRRYDPAFLAKYYHVFYCNSDYPWYLAHRICFPVYFEGRLIGIQGRYIGEPPKGVAKYLHVFKKSRVLYNFDVARQHDWVILVEGVFDAIRLGSRAVASFGGSLSGRQIQLLSLWKHVAVLYEYDYIPNIETFLRDQKRGKYPKHAFPVILPEGTDPDSLGYDAVMRRIVDVAQCLGIQL